ncbi:MAG: zinc metallopeptidase [Verrucomicrobiota bacterium]
MVGLLIVFAVVLALTMWARKRYQKVYDSELKHSARDGLTGAEMARRLLESKGIADVKVVCKTGVFADFYDPGKKQLSLAPQHYKGSTYAALGIAAHEAGHAIQQVEGYHPLHWRVSAVRATIFLSVPLIIVGAGMLALGMGRTGVMILVAVWPLIAVANLVTIPIELDASERAKKRLREVGAFQNLDERVGVEKMMTAAAAKYVDGIFSVLSWLASLIPWKSS